MASSGFAASPMRLASLVLLPSPVEGLSLVMGSPVEPVLLASPVELVGLVRLVRLASGEPVVLASPVELVFLASLVQPGLLASPVKVVHQVCLASGVSQQGRVPQCAGAVTPRRRRRGALPTRPS